jgi:hypothetical protein
MMPLPLIRRYAIDSFSFSRHLITLLMPLMPLMPRSLLPPRQRCLPLLRHADAAADAADSALIRHCLRCIFAADSVFARYAIAMIFAAAFRHAAIITPLRHAAPRSYAPLPAAMLLPAAAAIISLLR